MKEVYKILKIKANDIHKNYAVRMSSPNDIVVPEVSLSNEILVKRLEKDTDIQCIIRDNCYMSFYRTSKNPLLDKLPEEVIQYMTDYLGIITKQMLAYCKWCFLEKTELQINNVINENKFDILWYPMGSLDYTWASDTIKQANKQLEYIKNKKMLFLKNARYNH